MRKWSILLLAALFAMMALVSPAAPASAQGPNLLQNPGMEAPFAASLPGKENCLIAVPWLAWFVEGNAEQTAAGYLLAPEYKMATWADYPGNRVRSGSLSQQYFHSFGNFQAGIYQVVPNVTPGARYTFELWVLTWSCDREDKGNCDGATSGDPSPMHVRIGIDPNGGGDPFNPAIVWSEEGNAYDAWTRFEVTAAAQGSTISVFVYSYPEFRSQDNNVYVDDAGLFMAAPPPSPTPRPTNPPTATPLPTETPLPTATPPPTATPLPPTATPQPPTATPQPTATALPAATDAPQPTAVPAKAPSQSSSGSGLLVPLAGLALLVAVSVGIVLVRRRGR